MLFVSYVSYRARHTERERGYKALKYNNSIVLTQRQFEPFFLVLFLYFIKTYFLIESVFLCSLIFVLLNSYILLLLVFLF